MISVLHQYIDESAAATSPTAPSMSRFYLIPESDFFFCDIWICGCCGDGDGDDKDKDDNDNDAHRAAIFSSVC